MDIRNNRNFIYRYYHAEGLDKNITVIIYHGWGSSVHSQHIIAELLSHFGYTVIIPEIIYHDSRSPLTDYFSSPQIVQKYFWPTIINSVEESNELLKDIESERIVLMGSSMGGFIAAGIFSHHSIVNGLICINGSGSWEYTEQLFRKRDGRNNLHGIQLEKIRKYDPNRKAFGEKRPILLLHGAEDSIIPIEGQEKYFQNVSRLKANQAKMNVYHNVNHSVTIPMIHDIVNWLNDI